MIENIAHLFGPLDTDYPRSPPQTAAPQYTAAPQHTAAHTAVYRRIYEENHHPHP